MVVSVTFFFVTVILSTINFVAVIGFAFFFGVVGIFMIIGIVVIMVFVMVVGFVGIAGRAIVVGSDAFIVVVMVITGHVSNGALGMFTGDLKELSQLIVQVVQLG